eukprot:7366476-Ditylum_brightwellii.AAC.1
MEPKKGDELIREEQKASLQYLIFLTTKRCGKVKDCSCSNGRKQCLCTPKDEASTSTVATETLILSFIIYIREARYFVMHDKMVGIPGAFM